MMAKRLAILCIAPIVFCFFYPGVLPLSAKDDPSYYGDGASVSWEELSQYLSPLYQNTPYISVSNGSEVRRFSFNIELFTDLGLYVYGEPSSVQFSGTVNDFKTADYGYFRVQSDGTQKNGEYRYLGYSLSGVPMTNTRFPNEIHTDFSEMTLMKYTDLPESLKETYQVKGIDNEPYAVLRDLIEAPDSPVWEFENINNGVPITLRERLEGFGLMQNGVPSFSLLDYAIIYSWAETGGILRVFYQSKNNKEVIRYATFTGPVSVDFARKLPEFTAELSIPPGQPGLIGDRKFRLGPDQESLSLQIDMKAVLLDGYAELTEFGKAHTYTRADIQSLTLSIQNTELQNTEMRCFPNEAIAQGSLPTYTVPAEILAPGRNTLRLSGTALVRFEGKALRASCSLLFDIIYEPFAETPAPSAMPETPAPTAGTPAAPETTPDPTAYRFAVSRKW